MFLVFTFFIPCLSSTTFSFNSIPFGADETDLVIPIHYGLNFGSLTTSASILRNTSPPIDTEVELRFENDRDQSPSDEETVDNVDFVLTGRLGNSDDSRNFVVQLPRSAFAATRSFLRSAVIDISGGSIFSHTAGAFLLVPPREGESTGSLVIQPRNIRDYCYNGELSIAEYVGNSEVLVRVTWMYGGTFDNLPPVSVETTVAFNFSPDRLLDWIPNHAWNAFITLGLPRALGNENFEVIGAGGEGAPLVRFDCSSETVLDNLPTLVYEVLRSQDELVPTTFIHLFPRDYVNIIDGRCYTRFSPSTGAHGTFGMPTLSRTVVYIDSIRRQVGFGEPV